MKQLSATMRLGDSDDQIEAMLVMQGRFPPAFVGKAFLSEQQETSKNVQKPIELHQVQGLLDELIKEGKHAHSKWFALLTLVELGDRRVEVLQELIKHSVSYTKAYEERLERAGQNDFPLYIVANETSHLIDETMRALAAFKGNIIATETVIKVLDGDLLRGSCHHRNSSTPFLHPQRERNAIGALGALGDPTTRERLEYLASHGTGNECAAIALAEFGKATYDEIMAKVEST